MFRPRSQFFPIRTDHKPVKNFFIFSSNGQAHQGANQRRSSAGCLQNLWQSSETFGNLQKQFKSVFHRFYDFLKFSKKSSEIFGSVQLHFFDEISDSFSSLKLIFTSPG